MADFYQTGVVSTLHRLNHNGLRRIEAELEAFAEALPVGLILPALYAEFERPAMRGIVSELAQVRYLNRVVVVIGKATREQFLHARSFFDGFRTPVTCVWLESPGMRAIQATLESNGLAPGCDGKGRACWLAFGYLLACGDCEVAALHDCDIVNYSRELLARLCYPVANPKLGYEFCKGYYARTTDRLHGRVTRLFMTPLIRALESVAPNLPFVRFLDSFRYPLAGEFAMRLGLARVNRIPGDWGLEVGVLAEVYRNCALGRICQADLADNYEHKHQDLSPGDATRGLRKMACDIAKSLLRTLASEGHALTQDLFRNLEVRYVRMAEDTIHRYYADALLNGLQFDRHEEELAVATFSKSLRQAAREFREDPLGQPLIPNWNRVTAAIPDILPRLRAAAEHDAKAAMRMVA